MLAGADSGVLGWQPVRRATTRRRWWSTRCRSGWPTAGSTPIVEPLWGWSLGGRGSLLLAETYPDFAARVAAFSPAISRETTSFDSVDALADLPLAIWCGTEDMFYENVRAFVAALLTPSPRS